MYGTPIYVILRPSPCSTPHLKIPGWRSLQCRLIQWLIDPFLYCHGHNKDTGYELLLSKKDKCSTTLVKTIL